MRVRNEIDRYHLLLKVAENCEISEEDKQKIRTFVETQLKKHNEYIIENGVDLPEIENWNWND